MELLIAIILIVFGILQIILFFKIWGMTNDIKSIKIRYVDMQPLPSRKGKENVAGEGFAFAIDALVVHIATGKQMRVKQINEETGTYSCYTGGGMVHEGDFDEAELKLF